MDVNDLARELNAVDLDQEEAEIYLRLLQTGPTKARNLTRFFECSRSTLYRRLDELVDEGRVKKSLASPTVYEAVSPGELFEERQASLTQDRKHVNRVQERCQEALETLAGDGGMDPVEHQWVKLEGMTKIYAKVRRIAAEATSSIRLASNQETALARHLPDVEQAWKNLERKAREDDVDTRLLVDVEKTPYRRLEQNQGRGSSLDVRRLDLDARFKFLIVDGAKMVTWLRPTPGGRLGNEDDVAFFTDAPGSLTPHRLLFDRLWEESPPLAAPRARTPSENGEARA